MPNNCPQWGLYRGVRRGFTWPQDKTGTWQGAVLDIPSFVAWFETENLTAIHILHIIAGHIWLIFYVVIVFQLWMLTNNGIYFSFLIIPTCPFKHFIVIITLPVILILGKYWFGQPLICKISMYVHGNTNQCRRKKNFKYGVNVVQY